jgi:hypothetical protein
MALQMEDALAADVAKLDRLNGVKRVLAGGKTIKHLAVVGVASVNGSLLVPVAAVDDWIGHACPQMPTVRIRPINITGICENASSAMSN